MAEKGEKAEREEKEVKRNGGRGIQVISLILILVLIVLLLIVVQVPYTTTNAVKETVPFENCTQADVPYVSVFRTGFNYDTSQKIYSFNGQAIYRYSDLNTYLYANIKNMGKEGGIYCLNAQAYLVNNLENNGDSLSLFQDMIARSSDKAQLIENWSSGSYSYPICTQLPIAPTSTDTISLWTPSLLSNNLGNQYELRNVYLLFTVVPPTAKECTTVSVENITQQEVTRYCNAWKHVIGKC